MKAKVTATTLCPKTLSQPDLVSNLNSAVCNHKMSLPLSCVSQMEPGRTSIQGSSLSLHDLGQWIQKMPPWRKNEMRVSIRFCLLRFYTASLRSCRKRGSFLKIFEPGSHSWNWGLKKLFGVPYLIGIIWWGNGNSLRLILVAKTRWVSPSLVFFLLAPWLSCRSQTAPCGPVTEFRPEKCEQKWCTSLQDCPQSPSLHCPPWPPCFPVACCRQASRRSGFEAGWWRHSMAGT